MIYLQLQIFADDPLLGTPALAEAMVNTSVLEEAVTRVESCLRRKGWHRADVLQHENFSGAENQALLFSPLLYGMAKCNGIGLRIMRGETAPITEVALCAA